MISAELADLLQSWGLGTVGADIFINELPENINKGLVVTEVGGEGWHNYVDTITSVVDIQSIDTTTENAYKKLVEVLKHINRRGNYTSGNLFIYFSNAGTAIEYLGRELDASAVYRVSVQLIYRDTTIVS
jgi:hypothetical protein